MFKEDKIEIFWKLFCFLMFLMVICFLNNIFSLLFLFLYFFLANRKKDDSFLLTLLYLLTLLGVALGFVNNNLWLFKLFLIFDYCYYFMHYFKENKQSFLTKEKVNRTDEFNNGDDLEVNDNLDYYDSDEIVVSDDKINAINNELKKGNLLKDEDIDLIKSHLDVKEKSDLDEKKNMSYLRFSGFKKNFKSRLKGVSKSYQWQFNLDDINGIYVVCHLLILILAIVVE